MRIGVVGTGYWGSKVAAEYSLLKAEGIVDKVLAYDIVPDRGRNLPIQGLVRAASLDTLFEAVDAVHICTPIPTHFSVATAALSRKKHVLVEKPMATSARECQDLMALAAREGLLLQVGHIFRFSALLERMRELIVSGKIGVPQHFSLSWTQPITNGGGANAIQNSSVDWDLLPHPVDILNQLTDTWPDSVRGLRPLNPGSRSGLMAHVFLSYNRGPTALVEVSFAHCVKRREIQVIGSEGMIIADVVEGGMTRYGPNGERDIFTIQNNTLRGELEHFVASIESGKNSRISSVIGLQVVSIIEKSLENQ